MDRKSFPSGMSCSGFATRRAEPAELVAPPVIDRFRDDLSTVRDNELADISLFAFLEFFQRGYRLEKGYGSSDL